MNERRRARRRFLGRCLGGVAAAAVAGCRSTEPAAAEESFEAGLAGLEGGGRLGFATLDTRDGSLRGRRLDERFALCSTFKLVLSAMTLDRAERGGRPLDARLSCGPADLLAHSPRTKAAVEAAQARGETSAALTLAALAEAVQTTSDNGAANLLLRDLGGPPAFNAFCRAHGDATTRLDRYEPEMNDVRPGDARDTTTPRAAAELVARLFGGGIGPRSRALLREWMIATKTGATRVRRGLPADWIAGDKTGTGGGGVVTVKCNDLVWIEPPGRPPVVVAAYFDAMVLGEWPTEDHEAVLAAAGALLARRL